ncbi:hypothetical protein RJ639_013625 [Escallonia herrerae]|uniref:ADP/ATP translocase n=1 Tax=Escallonia herrerae TaxID=1293975 RepID=A0AA88VNM9_9ASTE|nr:hypothetical protein RJ639_013625 [Escallonia herrerae]
MAAFKAPSAHTSHFAYGNYSNAGLRYPVNTSFVAANPSPVFIQAPGAASFAINFLMGAVSAAVSKLAAAPVKFLIQNQDEMIKSGQLSDPYKGIGDCFGRTIKDEGFVSLWRGNTPHATARATFCHPQATIKWTAEMLEDEVGGDA